MLSDPDSTDCADGWRAPAGLGEALEAAASPAVCICQPHPSQRTQSQWTTEMCNYNKTYFKNNLFCSCLQDDVWLCWTDDFICPLSSVIYIHKLANGLSSKQPELKIIKSWHLFNSDILSAQADKIQAQIAINITKKPDWTRGFPNDS